MTELIKWWYSKDLVGKIAGIIAVVICLYDLLFVWGLLVSFGIQIMVQSHRGLNLAAFIALTFLLFPKKGRQRKGRIPWYDLLLLLMGVVPCIYSFFFLDTILDHFNTGKTSAIEIILFFVLLPSLLEGGRRVAGLPMVLIAACFIFHAFFSDYFPGFLYSRSFSLPRVVASFYLSPDGILGMPVGVASTVVAMFVLFAYFLLNSGGGKFFIDFSLAATGRFRGGPAKTAVVASALFGTLSGSPAANVVGTGSVTIPLMKSIGYKPEFAGAVEAVASNGGQIMPPVMGVVAFVMAEMTGISYAQICFASALPAILYYSGLFAQIDLEAVKLGLRGLPKQELPPTWKILKKGWPYIAPLVVLILLLAVFRYSAEMSAIYALGTLFLVSMADKESRMTPYKILVSLESAGRAMCIVTVTCGVAGIIIGSVTTTGVGANLATGIIDISGGNIYILLVLTAITCFILGMGISSIPIYLMLAVLVAPALLQMGVPTIAAHLFIFYWGIVAYITPPVCFAAFVAAGIAEANPMKTGWIATRLGIVTYIVPFMFVLKPVLVMIGSPAEIVLTTIASFVGVLILAMGVVGIMYVDVGALSVFERILLIAGALLLIDPGWVTDIIGVCLVAPIVVWRLMMRHSSYQVAKGTENKNVKESAEK